MNGRAAVVRAELALAALAATAVLLAAIVLLDAGRFHVPHLLALAVGVAVAPDDPALPVLALVALALPSLIACRRHVTGSGR